MSKKRKSKPEKPKNSTLQLIELQLAVMQHASSLKGVTELLSTGKQAAAIAKLDGAVTALHAVIRGQCAGVSMRCHECESEQDVVAWVDDGTCNHCGAKLEIPPNDNP